MYPTLITRILGVSHFLLRNRETGKFERITDPEVIETALIERQEGDYYRIYTKDPNVHACIDLMNRALGKPAQQVALTGDVDVNLHAEITARLQNALQREASMLDRGQSETEKERD